MFPAVRPLVIQIMQHCIHRFRLTADTISRSVFSLRIVDKTYTLPKEPSRRKAIFQITTEYFSTIFHQLLPVVSIPIFPSIESVKQNTSDKSYFGHRRAITRQDMHSGTCIIRENRTIDKTFNEIIAHYLFHLFRRIGCTYGLRSVHVVTILPSTTHKTGKIIRTAICDFPSKHHCFSFSQLLIRFDLWCQSQLTDITFRGFTIGKTKGKSSLSVMIGKTCKSDGSLTRENYFPFTVSSQSVMTEFIFADHRQILPVFYIVNSRQRSTETIFTNFPAIGCMKSRRPLWRSEVLSVPKSWHIELTVTMTERSGKLLAEIEINIIQSSECHLHLPTITLVSDTLRDYQW